MSSGDRRISLKPLENYRSLVDAASYSVSQGSVSGGYNNALGALMHLLNFANTWYAAQVSLSGNDEGTNLRFANIRISLLIHLLLSRRICDLTGKVVALNVQRRLLTRDSILSKILTNRKISDTSAALMFRLENVTAAFSSRDNNDANTTDANSSQQKPESFPDGLPDSLSFIETCKSAGYSELIGVQDQVREMETRINASLVAKTSTMVLLYGPPGTGKTSLIVAAAREHDMPVATVTASNLGGEFIGEREQNTADLFDYLEKVQTDFFLFIDEADSFLPETYENNTQSRLTRVLTINRLLRLVNRNDGITRIVMLASNYDNRIARDVSESSFKLLLPAPATYEQMKDLFTFYRKRANMNMTRKQMDYAVRTALTLGYAPGHVSLLIQRLLTGSIIKLLNNRISLMDVQTNLFEKPIYMIEQNKSFEDERQSITLVLVSNEPRAEGDDSAVPGVWEKGNPIAFPVTDFDVDFVSLCGRQRDETQQLEQPPTVELEFVT